MRLILEGGGIVSMNGAYKPPFHELSQQKSCGPIQTFACEMEIRGLQTTRNLLFHLRLSVPWSCGLELGLSLSDKSIDGYLMKYYLSGLHFWPRIGGLIH
ncbi:MAG: hypothetical protein WCR20_09040 [Verrucomicrobiota bacterium]